MNSKSTPEVSVLTDRIVRSLNNKSFPSLPPPPIFNSLLWYPQDEICYYLKKNMEKTQEFELAEEF